MSTISAFKYGATIMGIQFPQSYTDKDTKVRVKNESLAKCKKLYRELQDALETTSSYILTYERAVDSTIYAVKQIELALKKLAEIEDENKNDIETQLKEDIKEIQAFAEAISPKLADLNSVYNKLNEFSAQVVSINKCIKDYKIPCSVNDSL